MRKASRLRALLRILGGLVLLFLLILVGWIFVAGPVTVLRVLRYGDTNIGDYEHYPFRRMAPSPSPFVFMDETRLGRVPEQVLLEGNERLALEELIADNDTIAFLVIRDDAILFERYYQGHSLTSLSQAFSVSKSFLSTLIGTAIHDGILQSIDQPVTDYVPELAGNGFDRVTIRHLLTMTSGSNYVENDNPFGIHVILNYTPDLVAKLMDVRVVDEPGTVFRYKSGDNALLALALDRALGAETVAEYTERALWMPLGMEHEGMWSLDSEGGMEKTWCCLAATARDFAKLGRLYLRNGDWDGRQIFDPEWALEAAQAAAIPESVWPNEFRDGPLYNYGYQWWLVSEEGGDSLALGKDGQYIYVNPTTNTTILRLGWSQGSMTTGEWIHLFQYLSGDIR